MSTTMQRHTCSLSPDRSNHAKLHASGKESAVFTKGHLAKNRVSAIYSRIRDIFVTRVRGSEPFVTCGKALTHLRVHSSKPPPVTRREDATWLSCADRNHCIRDAFMDARLAYLQFQNTEDGSDRQRHMANACTALRTMVVHGLTDLLWCHSNGHTPSCEEFDWLIDYLVDALGDRRDYDTACDALLVLSAMRGLGSSILRPHYVDTLIRCMDLDRPRRLQYAALRVVSDAREELSSVTHDQISQGADLLDALSRAILGVAQHFQYRDDTRNHCYLRLISVLAKNDEWCKRLTRDQHLKRCNYLLDNDLESPFNHNKSLLTMIFLRIDLSDKDHPAITPHKCWMLIKMTWNIWGSDSESCNDLSADVIDALPTLVTATRQNVFYPDNDSRRAGLARDVHWVWRLLEERSEFGQADDLLDAALPLVQDLYNELSSYAPEHPTRQQ